MADNRSFIRDHYIDEYFNNAAEPHRRRPAIVGFPCTVWHVGVYHQESKSARRAFLKKIKAEIPRLLSGWRIVHWSSDEASGGGPSPFEPLDARFLDRFFNQAWFTGEGSPESGPERLFAPLANILDGSRPRSLNEDSVFCFECVPPDHEKWTLRFDLHTEYFTFSMFTRMDIGPSATGRPALTTYHWDGRAVGGYRTRTDDISAEGGVNPLEAAFRYGFVAPPDLPLNVETGPICEALRTIISAAGRNVFADFRSVVTDWRLFERDLRPEGVESAIRPAAPGLCHETFGSLQEPHDHTATKSFLNRIWPTLSKTIFCKASENIVGCYMEDGHSLYLSALGAQGMPPDAGEQSLPLTSLLIYATPEQAEQDGNPHRWRLSRLTHRVLEVGTRRTASLRHLRELRRVSSGIRKLEGRLDRPKSRLGFVYQRLHTDLDELDNLYKLVSESLAYRVHRASRHYNTMMTLVEDLGIKAIPGWLPYDEFVKRRLSGTHDMISSLIPRMQAIENRVRVRLQELNSAASLLVATIGSLAVIVAGFYGIARIIPGAVDRPAQWAVSALAAHGLLNPGLASASSAFIGRTDFRPIVAFLVVAVACMVAWRVFVPRRKKI